MKNLLIIALLAVGCFCGFVYYKTGNVPVREWSEQLQQDGFMGTFKKISAGEFVAKAKKIANEVTSDTFTAPPVAPVKIYKWTDEKGVVHYDSQEKKGAEALNIDPNNNVLSMDAAPDIGINEKPPVDEAQQAMENVEKIRKAMEARAGI